MELRRTGFISLNGNAKKQAASGAGGQTGSGCPGAGSNVSKTEF